MPKPTATQTQRDSWSAVVRWLTDCLGGQIQLARAVKVTRQTVANWSDGRSIPYGKHRTRLLELYGNWRLRVVSGIPDLPQD